MTAAAAVVLLHNVGYFWTKKRSQFLERAAPTEQLIAMARPIWVRCFPRNGFIAEEAARLGAGVSPADLVWDEKEALRRRRRSATGRDYQRGKLGIHTAETAIGKGVGALAQS